MFDLNQMIWSLVANRSYFKQTFKFAVAFGGRYQKFNETLEYFFGEMKKANAKLVFIARIKQRRPNDNKEYNRHDLLLDDHLWYNLMNNICPKYGQVYTLYGNQSTTLAYARQQRGDVMAFVTRNTQFLVYDSNFTYWSLSHLDIYNLKIMKFCRSTLYKILGMNQQQMQLMLAISVHSNDKNGLLGLVEYVKSQPYKPMGYDVDELDGIVSDYNRRNIAKQLAEIIEFDSYSGNWRQDILNEDILDLVNTDKAFNIMFQYYKEHIYFACKLLNETLLPVQRNIPYIATRDSIDFIELVIKITLKLYGIIFKEVDSENRPKTRSKVFQHGLFDEPVDMEMEIIYPTSMF